MLLDSLRGPDDVPVPYPLRRLGFRARPTGALPHAVRMPVEWHEGHLLVRPLPGAGRWLIDTGAALSATHRHGERYLGASLREIERLVGTELERLVGLDVLGSQPVLLNRQFVTFGAPRPANARPVSVPAGHPLLPMLLDGVKHLATFDTGAKLSYVLPRLAGEPDALWRVVDFFPPLGEWETAVYPVSVQIAGNRLTLMAGVLPPELSALVNEDRPLLIGSELLDWVDVWMDLRNGEVAVGRFA